MDAFEGVRPQLPSDPHKMRTLALGERRSQGGDVISHRLPTRLLDGGILFWFSQFQISPRFRNLQTELVNLVPIIGAGV